jgi:hypothetical protein
MFPASQIRDLFHEEYVSRVLISGDNCRTQDGKGKGHGRVEHAIDSGLLEVKGKRENSAFVSRLVSI